MAPTGNAGVATITHVMILDQEPAVRRGLEMRLALEPDMAVVGHTGDLGAALDMATATCPDIILMDAEVSGEDTIASLPELVRCGQGSKVIILSLKDDRRTRERAGAAGAAGFVGKQEPIENLLDTIRRAASSSGEV